MSVTSEIIEDKRPIQSIWYENDTHYKVGQSVVTKIESYGEVGEYASQPWLKVFKGEEIYTRIPAKHVAIVYHLEGEPELLSKIERLKEDNAILRGYVERNK